MGAAEGAQASLPAAGIPQNPFLAPNGRSQIHNDAYQSDTYEQPGPVGERATVRINMLQGGPCGAMAFDSKGRMITLCLSEVGWRLVMLDPISLETKAVLPLPPINPLATTQIYGLFLSGGYFFLDQHDRISIAANTRQIWHVEETEGPAGPGFRLVRTTDLSGAIPPNDSPVVIQPDWSGRIWFATTRGVVGTVDPKSGEVQSLDLGGEEGISNGLATDESGGVYAVSTHAMYRFDATATGAPAVTWREPYERTNRRKEGAVDDGSGTTPTVLGRDYVAITDYADPRMHVVVYRRAPSVSGPREVCAEPVFAPYKGQMENSLIGYRNSIIVENNWNALAMINPTPEIEKGRGLSRVDIVERGGRTSCRTVWTSNESAPVTSLRLSTASGLIYTWTAEPGPDGDRFYVTGLDFATGRTAFKVFAASGFPWGIASMMAIDRPELDGGCTVYMGGGFGVVRVTGDCPTASLAGSGTRCLPRRLAVSGRRIGPARLGRSYRAFFRRYRAVRRARRATRFCVRGGGRFFVGARRGKIDFVATTARGHRTRRLGPGRRVPRAGISGARHVGRRLLVGHRAGRGRVVYGVRRGRVRFLATITSRQAVRTRSLARRLRGVGLVR